MPAAAKFAEQISPERQYLAEKNTAVAEWQAWIERLNTEGAIKALEAFGNADRRVDAAKVALKEAEKIAARAAVSRLLDDADTTAPVAQARAELTAAEAALSNASAASRALDAEITSADKALTVAVAYRDEAVGKVLAAEPAVAALLAEWHAIKARALSIEAALSVVSSGLPNGWNNIRNYPVDQSPALAWRAALAALESDATAALPGGDNPPLPDAA